MKHWLFTFVLLLGQYSLFAWGAGVTLKWDPIKGSTKYEIEILYGSGKVETHEITVGEKTQTEWKGKLSFGYYRYRIRGWDKFDRPGEWSEPYEAKVAPSSPETVKQAQEIRLTPAGATILLQWKPSKGADHYLVKVIDSDGKVDVESTATSEFKLTVKQPGKFTWSVTAQISKFRLPASIGAIESEPSEGGAFSVAYPKLEAPQFLKTIVKEGNNRTEHIRLAWLPVNEAIAYEVEFEPKEEEGKESSRKSEHFLVKHEVLGVTLPRGEYQVAVRAVASENGEEAFRGPQSFQSINWEAIDGVARRPMHAEVSLGTSLLPYQYEDDSGLRNLTAQNEGTAANLDLRLKFNRGPSWGIVFQGTYTGFKIQGEKISELSTSLGATYSLVGKTPSDLWKVSLNSGIKFRQMFDIASSGDGNILEPSISTLSSLGPFVGTGVTRKLTSSIDLGLVAEWYLPIAAVSLPSGTSSNLSLSNIRTEIDASYWIGRAQTIVLGLTLDHQTMSYHFLSESTPEQITNVLAGVYVSYVWSW